ncbi:amidohydrolase [Bermanella marisrubri]|uniref:Peptidase M20D, amidohydrolase n=1 Tax=Bermanella marisrubri TaxID=207949 RepID=Q1MYK3_9GAMM|nr:N(2)-acetyl-L-2,4-diaminobutanoate deacetylase DoeB2 [Bermanella marisrubri]EAT11028.1 Peptidase M20D, amidohydrolase [Oceanobacter sp. RED65] [Bermanella marisrubri]QIZ82984.1 amidohydrolase [Bermanella marisrubri]
MQNYWQQTLSSAHQFRHDLHAHPELGWQEQRTASKIREALSSLNIPWRECAETGTLGFLNPNGSGRHIALRGDIDALPISEKTDKAYSSNHEGCMHACGHDGHTATLMATARWLKNVEDSLPGPVTLLFQPAEEGGHGAKKMIEDGALDGVDMIFGWHNWPALKMGQLVCPEGIVMCGNGTFEIEVIGKGGHASQPELCRDPVLAASAMVLNVQQIISRRLPPQQSNVVSITSIEAPSAATVIPERVKIGGSIRIATEQARQTINSLIQEICEQTAATYGVQAKVQIIPRYQATVNHNEQAQAVRDAWVKISDDHSLEHDIAVPIMASEDFSYYLKEVPGAFALIGADDGEDHHHPCHSPYYDFNDSLVEPVTKLYAQLVGATLP